MKSKQQMLDELQLKFGRKDLSFGCEVEIEKKIWDVITFTEWNCKMLKVKSKDNKTVWDIYIGDSKENFRTGGIRLHDCEKNTEIKIIGHPLTLSDMLLKDGEIARFWNLKFNLLRDQSEKLIRFIHKILFSKNND